ncbi:hypothetical protein V5799_030375 [Amblyomma americanum]|uniref:KRAB-related domain-containing protein n=1 Tax=Amblyomma americanum TaxID=6943 RepID=A0AAQ4ENE3_AMBAM
MASEDDFAKIRHYFTDEEWKGLSECMKTADSNLKKKYELMLNLGLKPLLPEFMKPKPAPAKPAKPATKSNSPSPETSSSGSRYPRRQRKDINYMECENSDEEYLFCDDCGVDHPGDCPKHGPLTHVKDAEIHVPGVAIFPQSRTLHGSAQLNRTT